MQGSTTESSFQLSIQLRLIDDSNVERKVGSTFVDIPQGGESLDSWLSLKRLRKEGDSMEQTDIICGQLHVIVSVQVSENGIEDEKQVVNAFQQCSLHDKYSAATPNAPLVLGERNSLPVATSLCARKQAVNGRDLSSSSPGAFQRRIGSMIETRGSVIEGMKKEEIIANLKKRREAFFETIKPKEEEEEEETAGHQYTGNACTGTTAPIESTKKTLSDGDMKSKIASETSEVGGRTDNIKKSSSSEGLFEADNRKGSTLNKNEEALGETIVTEKQLRLNKQSRIQSMECHTGPRNYKADGTVITFADIVPPGVAASLSSAERKRQDIIYELIATEYQYVEDLLILIEVSEAFSFPSSSSSCIIILLDC